MNPTDELALIVGVTMIVAAILGYALTEWIRRRG